MNRMLALMVLLVNLLRSIVRSGWQTGLVILMNPTRIRSGWTRLAYGELGEQAASLLAACITLSPGTTAVFIDTERRALLVHLLDLDHDEATLDAIRCDLLAPIARLTGVRR